MNTPSTVLDAEVGFLFEYKLKLFYNSEFRFQHISARLVWSVVGLGSAGVRDSCPGNSSENSHSERSVGDNPRGPCCNPLGCSAKRGDWGPVLEPWQGAFSAALNPLMYTRRLTHSVREQHENNINLDKQNTSEHTKYFS